MKCFLSAILAACFLAPAPVHGDEDGDGSGWVRRDKRWMPRGSWNWALRNGLPELSREFNGIDFGHTHLAETLLATLDEEKVERARLQVLKFIFSSPSMPPDDELVAPTFVRMVWELQKTFNWTHMFHRSLYDLFASDVEDKGGTYQKLLSGYLAKPEAVTPHMLDHHGKLWSFPESKSFRTKFPKFNSQIWAYHWLQAATYDVQLMGPAARQRELSQPLIAHYHGYLNTPPVEWQFMPMMEEAAPEFSKRFMEAASIFNNLHMLHDNVDDILSRPDLYPSLRDKRKAILKILAIYLHRNHGAEDRYEGYHGQMKGHGEPKAKQDGDHKKEGHAEKETGPRSPDVKQSLEGARKETPKEPHHENGGKQEK